MVWSSRAAACWGSKLPPLPAVVVSGVYLIPRFDRAGVRFAEADGIIDLGTDSGRLAARILVAVAKWVTP